MEITYCMFGPKHYVPILKWKRAEQSALQALNDKDKQGMTPLIQFVMPKAKSKDSPEKQFESVIADFREKTLVLRYRGEACFADQD